MTGLSGSSLTGEVGAAGAAGVDGEDLLVLRGVPVLHVKFGKVDGGVQVWLRYRGADSAGLDVGASLGTFLGGVSASDASGASFVAVRCAPRQMLPGNSSVPGWFGLVRCTVRFG